MYSSIGPYTRMLNEFRRLMDELCFEVPEFIWSDTGLTESLYSSLIEDIKLVKMWHPDPNEEKANSQPNCPWQRKVQLALIQLRLGTDRTATGRIYKYRTRVPSFYIGLEWIDKALLKTFTVRCKSSLGSFSNPFAFPAGGLDERRHLCARSHDV